MRSIDEHNFSTEVLESTVPVLVHFWAPWCGLCRAIEPLLRAVEAEAGDRLQIAGINADRSLQLASQYQLTALPTLILFDGGRVAYRIDGYYGRDDLRLALKDVVRQVATLQFKIQNSKFKIKTSV